MPSSNPNSESPATEPTWSVAHLFPAQGQWTENEFLALHSNRLVELVDGQLEVLPMPTWLHQLIVDCLCDAVKKAIGFGAGGRVLQAPLPVRLFDNHIREPDVMYFAPGSEPRDPRGYPTRVDLAMEVVSEGVEARKRDYEDKRRDYARAAIAEYWIVDPELKQITVLMLQDGAYRLHGEFKVGETATSMLLPGLQVDVTQVMEMDKPSSSA